MVYLLTLYELFWADYRLLDMILEARSHGNLAIRPKAKDTIVVLASSAEDRKSAMTCFHRYWHDRAKRP